MLVRKVSIDHVVKLYGVGRGGGGASSDGSAVLCYETSIRHQSSILDVDKVPEWVPDGSQEVLC